MINKKIGCGLLCLMSLGLLACGEPASEEYPQVTDTIEETIYSIAITGAGTYLPEPAKDYEWNPAKCNETEALKFTRVSKLEYKLENITFSAGDLFKFVFGGTWNDAIGYSGLDKKASAYANFEDDGGNCKVKVAGTYDFFYHPFWVSDTVSYGGSMAIKLHA